MLIGRLPEQETLENIYDSKQAEFLAIFGRRRIGETFLIKHFFTEKRCVFFHATGIQQGALSEQITRFVKVVSEVFYKGSEIKEQLNWFDAFDALIYKHLPQVRKKLAIPVTAIANSWRYIANKKVKEDGAQIDLLFDRRDGNITICEIKYSENPFVIDKQYAKNLSNKRDIFIRKTRTKKHILIAIIAARGIKDNLYANDLLDSTATLNDLFQD